MSVEVHKLQRLRVFREASFGTDASGSLSSFIDVPAVEGSIQMKIEQDELDPATIQVYKDKHIKKVLGVKRWTLSFSIPMISPGATSAGVAHTRNALGYILRDVFGGENLMQGFAVDDASPATTDFTHTGANSSAIGLLPGAAYGITTSGTTYEWRIAKATGGASSSTVTHKLATADAPSDEATVYGTSTYYLAENPTNSLQFAVYGVEGNDRFLLMGGQEESMTFDIKIGALPMITFNFRGSDWRYGDSVGDGGIATYASSTSWAGTITEASYSGLNFPVVQSGYFYQQTLGDASFSGSTNVLPTANESWSPRMGFVPQTGPNATQTVFKWIRNRVSPVITGTFNIPYEDVSWIHNKINRTDKAFVRVLGGLPGSTIILEVPTVQVLDAQRVEEGSLAYQQISWEANHDTETTAIGSESSSQKELRVSAFRLHFG